MDNHRKSQILRVRQGGTLVGEINSFKRDHEFVEEHRSSFQRKGRTETQCMSDLKPPVQPAAAQFVSTLSSMALQSA